MEKKVPATLWLCVTQFCARGNWEQEQVCPKCNRPRGSQVGGGGGEPHCIGLERVTTAIVAEIPGEAKEPSCPRDIAEVLKHLHLPQPMDHTTRSARPRGQWRGWAAHSGRPSRATSGTTHRNTKKAQKHYKVAGHQGGNLLGRKVETRDSSKLIQLMQINTVLWLLGQFVFGRDSKCFTSKKKGPVMLTDNL